MPSLSAPRTSRQTRQLLPPVSLYRNAAIPDYSLSIRFNGSMLIFLNRPLRKTSHILLALSSLVDEESSNPPITYYALDLHKRELERTLSELAASDVGSKLQGKVAIKGMWGTFEGGLKFIQESRIHSQDAVLQMEHLNLKSLRDMSPASYKDSESTGTHSSSGPGSRSEDVV